MLRDRSVSTHETEPMTRLLPGIVFGISLTIGVADDVISDSLRDIEGIITTALQAQREIEEESDGSQDNESELIF